MEKDLSSDISVEIDDSDDMEPAEEFIQGQSKDIKK